MADDDLDAVVRRVDPDRWLASRFVSDLQARTDVVALYAYDHELSRAGRSASTSLIAEIRLTWWRETLTEIFEGRMVRRHPVAHALAAAVGRRRLERAALEAMIDARIDALGLTAWTSDDVEGWAAGVGASTAAAATAILDSAANRRAAEPAGRVWALLTLRRAGLYSGPAADDGLRRALNEADQAARTLTAAAFPAIVQATLARARIRNRPLSELETRLRLLWSVLRGRL